MTRPFLPWPDKRLRQVAEPIDAVTDETHALWDEMIEIMEAMPGYGLAAPQIGVAQRLAVVDCSDERGRVIRLANPEIVATSDELFEYEEASPNLQGVSAKVKRPARVTVTFLDADGDTVRQDFEGVWATSVQHQIDHLNGRMYFDHLSRTRREMLLKKARKG
ncbi:MAG: peptide deformylase [Pseudomonadota bacterium]